jgi:hypothetical protein
VRPGELVELLVHRPEPDGLLWRIEKVRVLDIRDASREKATAAEARGKPSSDQTLLVLLPTDDLERFSSALRADARILIARTLETSAVG